MESKGIKSPLGKEDECNAYWDAANKIMSEKENSMSERMSREFRAANRIKVGAKYCYKPELWRNKGWCKLAENMKWGFCSSSCNLQFIKVTKMI